VGPERLDDVATVRVGKADVDHEQIRGLTGLEPPEQVGAPPETVDDEALLSKAAHEHRPEVRLVLEHHDLRRHAVQVTVKVDPPRW
jgi:hypothetical protein